MPVFPDAKMSANRRPVERRRGGRWARFVRRYGWRAYALPILSAITVLALVHDTPTAAPVSAASAHRGAATRPTQATQPTGGSSASTVVAPSHADASVRIEGLTGRDAGFGAGSTPAPVVVHLGDDTTSCATNTYQHLVLVSISKQHLWACEGGRQVDETAVTTGATVDDDQTPLGSWRVQAKQRDRYLIGRDYKDYVHYWVPFNGDFGLHDAPWQTMPFGSKNWPTEGSHGCVHVPTATMAWLYRWVGVGDTVVTVES
ncbi:L,D-transpeptidase [uncultured Jatrophihabitans sp.]|uniref:L,D-transpeptidase n=1 Tax=uncultured Jatrophihabitans sp. TaxID=1610747 RepID=UPI0035CA5FD6